MSRSTVTTIIERIRRQLASSIRMEINVLATSLPSAQTTLTVEYALEPSLRGGSILSIGTELLRVVTVNVASKEVTVIRGWQDTGPQDHATGAEIMVNPRFTRFDIFDAIVQEINSWQPDLFWIDYVQASPTQGDQVIKLPTQSLPSIGVIKLRGNSGVDVQQTWPEMNFVLQRGPVDWPEVGDSGLMIRVVDYGGRIYSESIIAEVAMPFDASTLTENSDLAADLNVTVGLLELIDLGVKMRLLTDAETGRSQREAQDEPRRAEDVQAGAAMTAGEMIGRRYDQRRNQEIHSLRARYPMRQW